MTQLPSRMAMVGADLWSDAHVATAMSSFRWVRAASFGLDSRALGAYAVKEQSW